MASDQPAALIRAAERLFATRGSAVSLREILAESGVGNASAIQYHFGDRAGLVRAVLQKHEVEVERRRREQLDAWEAAGADDLRQLAAALVEPLAAELSNADGGVGYLQLLSDLYNRPNPRFDERQDEATDTFQRWRRLALPLLDPDAVRLHRRFDALRFTVSELARRGHADRKDHRLFTSQLTDLVTGLLTAPVSDHTRQLFR